MKRLLMILLLTTLITACSRAASSPPLTEPPLNFPTLSPGALPLCQPSDLETSSNFNKTTDTIILGVTLTNKTKNLCTLSNPPQTTLIDARNKPLDLQIVDTSPSQTPPAPALMQLAPNSSAIVTLVWRNFCQIPPAASLILRLELAKDQNLDVEMKMLAEPACDTKNEPSTIIVAPYSVPP
jgi:hypothetical protein